MSTRSTSVEASAAWQAMKPEWRPISFTSADAVARAHRLDVRAADHVDRGRVGALEAEAAVDEVDVVVDGLGDADDGDLEPAPRRSPPTSCIAPRSVPSPPIDEQDVDAELLEAVDHLRGILARRARCRAMVPPWWWMSATDAGVSGTGSWPKRATRPS